MSAESNLVATLTTPALIALVADRIYPDVIPMERGLPAIAYARMSTEGVRTIHDGHALAEFASFQIQAWAKTRTDAAAVGDAIVAALEAAGEPPADRRSAYDEESGNFGDLIDVRYFQSFD